MRYWKLTDKENKTQGGTQWGVGITHKAKGEGKSLCSADVIHVYDHPLKAVMFNPIHAAFAYPHLWEVKVKKVVAHDDFKGGVKQATTIKQVSLPSITVNQRVRFALYCALAVYKEKTFVSWANNWLVGGDRSKTAASTAATAACASEAAHAAARAAIWAATTTAWAATEAASAAATAAWAAAEAASAAAVKPLDFVTLIKKAIQEEVEPCGK